jgi:hypothetical protein
MLVSKLLRIEEKLVEQIEELSKKMSETEYTSFSALARKLIRNGLKTFIYNKVYGIGIGKEYFSKTDSKDIRETEAEFILEALDNHYNWKYPKYWNKEARNSYFDGSRKYNFEDTGSEIKKNHLMIEYRSGDDNGDNVGCAIFPLDVLKNGDAIFVGDDNVYQLLVVSKDSFDKNSG